MLLLGGAATVEALTGMDYKLASFLIPWGVILYTFAGGLKATFLASYIHTAVIYFILVIFVTIVYLKTYSSDQIYQFLAWNVDYTESECEQIYSDNPMSDDYTTFFEPSTYSCGPVPRNNGNSYLTMISADGLMFGIINIVGNFGTVFVDQSYWQSAIAAKPSSAARGYLLGGICWFTIPFSLATSLGLSSTALMLPITAAEAGAGLVPPAAATHLLGNTGSALILVMLFMAIVSTGSAESIAVASLVSYDIYREYINPQATGDQILKVTRLVILVFGIFMGVLSLILYELGLNLGWVYLFMGIVIGSSVIPLWNMMTWSKASGKGAIIAAWGGFFLAVTTWLLGAKIESGEITVATLGSNPVMLSGNLMAILSSGLIHFLYSTFVDPQVYNFDELDKNILLVEEDFSGLTEAEKDPVLLDKAGKWIASRGWLLTFVLVLFWPLLSVPAGVFTQSYFAFWVLVSALWGFGAAIIITLLPLTESKEDILEDLTTMRNFVIEKAGIKKCPSEVVKSERKNTMSDSDKASSSDSISDSEDLVNLRL